MSRGIFDLTGKVVLSTGANSGIGLAFLQGCAKQGADVVVWGRRADKNAEALAHLTELGAPRAHVEAVDVSDETAVAGADRRRQPVGTDVDYRGNGRPVIHALERAGPGSVYRLTRCNREMK